MQFGLRNDGRIEIFGIRPRGDAGTATFFIPCEGARFQRLDDVATGEGQGMHAVFAPDRNFEAGRQRIRDRDADAVQTAGKGVRATRTFVEFAAGV
ncbi:hypothetical protein D3C81_1953820 [compost metagenome]